MPRLSIKACDVIADALQDAADIYDQMSDLPTLPDRLKRECCAKRHMARMLKEIVETYHIEAPDADPADHNAAGIWDRE